MVEAGGVEPSHLSVKSAVYKNPGKTPAKVDTLIQAGRTEVRDRMNRWLENSERNLLPLSRGDSFDEALGEWFFTGAVFDYEVEEVRCQLCEQVHLSHHFEIKNSLTGGSLLVGSSCILKFSGIQVRDYSGRVIVDSGERKSRLLEVVKGKIIESRLEPLRKLWAVDESNRSKIQELAESLKSDAGVPPNDLLFLLKQMDSHEIPYPAKNYKVSLKSYKERNQIFVMKAPGLQMIIPALSRSQLMKVYAWRKDLHLK
ncbi:MAG: hypothetical protein CVU57_12955 [Deltaproteobacteria bacterium HGW-Deltaproteobacteria-15]|jgi:hypothetical protein|nr:MAG: hypothetical protein CVU57_12955 [Deltaproteobacteria bacterium HGW-Deltaproteobacteria-15]